MGDRVFTGDTLLIRGTGRTDFQNGSSRAQYESIFNRLLKLPDETMVFPAHDYKGDTVSTIGEERRYNPRLQVRSVDEYIELMANLKLPNPKMMDVAVPANMHVGLHQEELAKQGLALSARDAIKSLGRPDILLVDLRETSERAKHGTISGALHAPYPGIAESLKPGGMLREVAAATGRRVVFFCAFGERSAMAVAAAKNAGLANTAHIEGGIDAWKKVGGPVVHGVWRVPAYADRRAMSEARPTIPQLSIPVMVGPLRCPPYESLRIPPTRFTSAVSASSASASNTPPHSVMRSGITMRFSGG